MLKRLFGLAALAFNLVFVVGILEVIGITFYLAVTDQQPAFARLREAGFTPANVVEFLTASPDRLAVAGGLALVGVVLVLFGGGGSSSRHTRVGGAGFGDYGDGDGDGGGFGGDGGGGGGGGE